MYEENQLADFSINFDDEINSNDSSSQISSSQSPATLATFGQMLQGQHATSTETISEKRLRIHGLMRKIANEPQLYDLFMSLDEEFSPSPTQISNRSTDMPVNYLQGQHKAELAELNSDLPNNSQEISSSR